MKTFSFENLEAWKQSRELVLLVYQIQSSFPSYERYGLGDQLRRAVVSVSSNFVEGNARYSKKEQIHFIEIAIGSLMEVYCQLTLAFDLEYVTSEQLCMCSEKIDCVLKLLNGLRYQKINSLNSKQKTNPPTPTSNVQHPTSNVHHPTSKIKQPTSN
ncbi:MAG: four helix bundle protein, partial [Bacteroidales bacterium]|nr:four helix bundle protein [Bacteroidales bacterium]